MTVNELIEQLKMVPGDSIAVIPGYEDGFDNIVLSTETIILDTNWDGEDKIHWMEGRHDRYHHGIEADNIQPINAVLIGRGK